MENNVVCVIVDNLEVAAFVDTAAAVSVVIDTLRKRLKKHVMPYDEKQLRGVGNDLLRLIGIRTARVQVCGYLVPVSFLIFSLCSNDLILRFTFLREQCFDLLPNRRACTFSVPFLRLLE